MRRFLALVLAFMAVAVMSVTAFAAEGSDKDNAVGDTASINVSGKFTAGGTSAEKVSVDVVWGAMEFTYTSASEGSWNASTHKYENVTEAGWTAYGNEIVVTNHSNVGINASFAFDAAQGTNIVGTFSTNGVSLARAEANSALDSRKAQVTFNIISGSIEADTDSLGTITVTIATAN